MVVLDALNTMYYYILLLCYTEQWNKKHHIPSATNKQRWQSKLVTVQRTANVHALVGLSQMHDKLGSHPKPTKAALTAIKAAHIVHPFRTHPIVHTSLAGVFQGVICFTDLLKLLLSFVITLDADPP